MPARVLSLPASTLAAQVMSSSPLPIAASVPAILRTMCCRKALAVMSSSTQSPSRVTSMFVTCRTAFDAWQPAVLAQQRLCRLVHAPVIEKLMNPPRPAAIQRRTHEAIENPVTVTPRRSREARVKVITNGRHPGHTDVVGEIGIGAQQPATLASFGSGVEMRHLPARMHARIRAPGAGHLDGFVRNLAQCLLDSLLHTQPGALALPAVIRGTVVLDADSYACTQPGSDSSSCCACWRCDSSPSSRTSSRMLRAPPGSPIST